MGEAFYFGGKVLTRWFWREGFGGMVLAGKQGIRAMIAMMMRACKIFIGKAEDLALSVSG